MRLRALSLALWLAVTPALAHHSATKASGAADSIAIANITHGQMLVLAKYRSDILRLVEAQTTPARELRRLQAFQNIQFSSCGWGLVPGTVSDEDSPFNECAHAYLAATRALLLNMQSSNPIDSDVSTLAGRIERDMLEQFASLVLCAHSDEAFNTGQIVQPAWGALPGHMPSLITFGAALATAGALLWLSKKLRRGSSIRSA